MIINFSLKSNSTFEEVVRTLDKSGEGFLPIINDQNLLLGVVTDGDIRRAFLNKENDLNKIINKAPLTAKEGTSKQEAIYILKKNHRRHLPIVNQENKLIDVIKLDNWEEAVRPNKVIIMAGGLGSRLGELTKEIPKPMLPLGNKPILETLINSFKEQGFFEFYLSVNHKADVIKRHFENGSKLGVNIHYIEEKERLGTAGALSLIKEDPLNDFIVINGDILSSINYIELLNNHINNSSLATMGVAKKQHTIQYGVVQFNENDEIEGIVEKPSTDYYINAGVYVLSPKVLKLIPKNVFYDMPTLFKELVMQNKKTLAYKIKDYWLDIGLKEDYYKAVNHMEK
jgi:dTDP-glucose pyrophosphorylase